MIQTTYYTKIYFMLNPVSEYRDIFVTMLKGSYDAIKFSFLFGVLQADCT